MKRSTLGVVVVLVALIALLWAFVALIVGLCSDEGAQRDNATPAAEKVVYATPADETLAVLIGIKDTATANAAAARITELTPQLKADIPYELKLNIVNEMIRLFDKACFDSPTLDAALRTIKLIDEAGYKAEPPLEVDGYEPTPEEAE